MPSSTPELRAEWGTSEASAEEYLFDRKFKLLLPTYYWVVPDEPGLSAKAYRAMQYLTQEWDYGGGWYFESEYNTALAKGEIDKNGKAVKKAEDHDT